MHKLSRAALAVLLVVVAAACSGDDDDDAATPTTEAAAATDDVVVRAGLSQMLGNELGAVLEVETEPPTPVSVTVDGPGGAFEIPATEETRIPVVGMRAESDYTITVTAGEGSQELTWTTGSLPEDLPPVVVRTPGGADSEPGMTVFPAFGWAPVPEGAEPPDAGYILAVDEEGEVVWYTRQTHQFLDVDTTSRGTFIVSAGESVIQEIDLFGEIVNEWATRVATDIAITDLQGRVLAAEDAIAVDFDSSHHEVTELANGNILTLSTELIELEPDVAAQLCPENPEPRIVGDVIVEMAPSGEVVNEWRFSDIFDPAELPGAQMCMVGPVLAPPNWFYAKEGGIRDWSHGNSVTLYEDMNALVVSARHFDGIFAIRYEDDDDGPAGELLWSFGENGELTLEGDSPHHQHAVEMESEDTMILYDNGNFRPGTTMAGGTEPVYSRAVQFRIDLEAGTATQLWEHRDTWTDGRTIFTPFVGDVDRLPNGNVLITHGGGSSAEGGYLAKIVEVIQGEAADGSEDEIVFDIEVGDGAPGPDGAPNGWTVYRAERLPSLYFAE